MVLVRRTKGQSSEESCVSFQSAAHLETTPRTGGVGLATPSWRRGAVAPLWLQTLTLFCLLSSGLCIFYTDSKENDFPRLGRRGRPFSANTDALVRDQIGRGRFPGDGLSLPRGGARFPPGGPAGASDGGVSDALLDVDVDEDGIISQKEYHIAMRPRHQLDQWLSKWNFRMSDTNSEYRASEGLAQIYHQDRVTTRTCSVPDEHNSDEAKVFCQTSCTNSQGLVLST